MYYVDSISGNKVVVKKVETDEVYWICKATGIKTVTGAAITNEDVLVVTGSAGKSKMYNLKTKKLIKVIANVTG